nr:ankyrin repeat-containing protein ITN1-like [Tanacetum cinerariifolium]
MFFLINMQIILPSVKEKKKRMASFCKASKFRFVLCKVYLSYHNDDANASPRCVPLPGMLYTIVTPFSTQTPSAGDVTEFAEFFDGHVFVNKKAGDVTEFAEFFDGHVFVNKKAGDVTEFAEFFDGHVFVNKKVKRILAEINEQMLPTVKGAEFDAEVAEIWASIVNKANELGETSLFTHAERAYIEVVKELLSYTTKGIC